MLNRRELIAAGSALLAASAAPALPKERGGFVRAAGTKFELGGKPYRIAGTNMWYAAYLGADAPVGNRDRLKRELDRLAALGINNIRIPGSSEFSPLKNSVRPTFRNRTRHFNETLLRGLDHALAEMGRRNMKAVIYLTNFWEWSGGMMTYLYWTNGGRYIDMNDPAHPWPEFADLPLASPNGGRRRRVVIDCWGILSQDRYGEAIEIVRLGRTLDERVKTEAGA